MDNPCRYCQERLYNCHANCKRYKDWKLEAEAKKEVLSKYRKTHGLNSGIRFNSTVNKFSISR